MSWEYRVRRCDGCGSISEIDRSLKVIEGTFNVLGDKGWELVCPLEPTFTFFIFKRPREVTGMFYEPRHRRSRFPL